jgi:hypothetical protein
MRSPLLNLDDVRESVKPEYAEMVDEDLEALVESAVADFSDGAAENFMGTLSSVGRAVVPTLRRAAPSVAQGAASGATVGGPWGALIGAGAGLASSALAGQRKPRAAAPGAFGAAATMAPTSPVATGRGAAPAPDAPSAAALPTGQGAAATILALFQDPTVRQALLSQALGNAGKDELQAASGATLPRGAINDLLVQLLANASESLPEAESLSEQSYLLAESGEYLIDPASPEQQAALVLAHLRSTAAPVEVESMDAVEWMDSESDWDSVEELGEMDEAAQFF